MGDAFTSIIKEERSIIPIPQFEETIIEEGILYSIIRSLPLKEAVRTCVLSPRWRNIWTHLPRLNFDTCMLDSETRRLIGDGKLTEKERDDILEGNTDQFIRSVDSVLQKHRGHRLEEIFINYYLTNLHSNCVDAWVQFALGSDAKKLGLHLHKPSFKEMVNDAYDFPCQMLRSSSLEELSLSCCFLRPPNKFDGLNHLKKLELFYVDITEDDIHHLLFNCHNLETLIMWSAPRLMRLCIPFTLSQFQHLLVRQCKQLREINISAVKLCLLRYDGPPVDFTFRESSQLTEALILLHTPVRGNPNLDFYLKKLSSALPHLRSLQLFLSGVCKVSNSPKCASRFIHLKHLDWTWSGRRKMSLLCLNTMLDAAPCLEEMKMHLRTRPNDRRRSQNQHGEHVIEETRQRLRQRWSMLPEQSVTHLKTIEIHNFHGDQWEFDIALYLLKNATELQVMNLYKSAHYHTGIYETDIENLSHELATSVNLAII